MRFNSRSFGRVCLSIFAGSLAIAGGACAQKAMPTPLPYRVGNPLDARHVLIDPDRGIDAAALAERDASIDVLYATDRAPRGEDGDRTGYYSKRGVTLRFGVATVRFGSSGDSIANVADRLARNKRPPVRVVDLHEFGESWRTIPISDPRYADLADEETAARLREPEEAFVRALHDRLGDGKRVLLYVPGFNTTFKDPVRYVGEFAFYLHGDVVPVAFSWPARDLPIGYSKQLTTARVSTRALRELILLLSAEPSVTRIDILSFSSGAPMVTDALHEIRLMHSGLSGQELRDRVKIGSVIYAGADEDVDRFRNMYLDGFADLPERITLYSSRRDLGLVLSQLLVRGSPRLGRLSRDLPGGRAGAFTPGAGNTHVIDVGYAQGRAGNGGLFLHGYWFGNAWVSSDVIAQVRGGLDPSQRGLVELDGRQAGVWGFPSDYPDRVNAAFASIAPPPEPTGVGGLEPSVERPTR